MKKYLLLFLKQIFWFSVFIFIAFLTIFFLSYLNKFEGLKDIPIDFFDTRYVNEDFDSDKNAFNDYVNFINKLNLNKEDIIFFSKKDFSKLSSSEKTIFKNKLNKYKKFIFSNKIIFSKIYKKYYIYQTPEYSGITGKTILNSNLFKYIKSLKYISSYYLETNNKNNGLKILLDHQTFIDFLINNSDLDLIQSETLIMISKINLESIDYILNNFNLTKKDKLYIYNKLNKDIKYNIIENGIKREYNSFYKILNHIYNDNIFYSKKETILLKQAFFYEVIKNRGVSKNFNHVNVLLYNYPGRISHNKSVADYSKIFKKESDLKTLRENILEKIGATTLNNKK